MVVRLTKDSDFERVIPLFKRFFTIHNQFQKPTREIIAYLMKQAQENTFLVNEDGGKINAALILVRTGGNAEGTHTVWKYRHFAFESEKAAISLIQEAEKRIRKGSKTAKVELTIAENENGLSLYKKQGYIQEAALKNHYRWGETCFILSKSFS